MLVVFGGRKISFIDLSPGILGWAGQLSIIKATFLFSRKNRASRFNIHRVKISAVIHAFLFAVYSTGSIFTFLKHRGFKNLPMTNKGSLSEPSELHPTSTVIRSLDFFSTRAHFPFHC